MFRIIVITALLLSPIYFLSNSDIKEDIKEYKILEHNENLIPITCIQDKCIIQKSVCAIGTKCYDLFIDYYFCNNKGDNICQI